MGSGEGGGWRVEDGGFNKATATAILLQIEWTGFVIWSIVVLHVYGAYIAGVWDGYGGREGATVTQKTRSFHSGRNAQFTGILSPRSIRTPHL